VESTSPLLGSAVSATNAERGFKKAILRLVKGGPERLAIKAGQVDSIIDPASGNVILLPSAQQALTEGKLGFRGLIGIAFDWYWEQNERYCFVSHSDSTDDTSGFAEQFIGKTLWDLSIENLSETDWRTHRQQLERRLTFRNLEVRLRDRSGGARYLSIGGRPIFDDRDQFKGYRGITRDITARKKSEAPIWESNRFARAILDALGAPVAILDHAGVVLASNQAWRASAAPRSSAGLGIPKGSSYLAVCDDVGSHEYVDNKAIAAGTRQVIAGDRAVYRYGYTCDSRTGERWFELRVSGIVGDDDARAIVLYEDITERKRGELLSRLEHRVMCGLAEADNSTSAVRSVIRAVCETQGWNCGRYFDVDQSDCMLRFRECWGIPDAAVVQFLEDSRGLLFRPGAGLAGRVYQSGHPLWVLDGPQDTGMSPTALAPETGEDGAFVFPVITEGIVVGVLSFSNPTIREPDDRMLQTVHSIGRQLGGFLRRQQSLEALRRSETRFRALTLLASDWYWEQDRDFRFTKNALGSPFDNADIIGLTHWELPNVILTDAKWAEHKSHLAARWSFSDFEFVVVQPDGQCGYYWISGEPMYDEAGAFIGYHGTGLSITTRRRAEIALHESETRLRALTGPSSD
jgi:PAS domain S-box-containing protein